MMKIVYRTTQLFLIFVLILICPALATAQDSDMGATLRWKAVPGAAGYKIEIRDGNGVIIRRELLTSPEINLDLPYGTYNGRVAALNKFKKPQAWSAWFTFSIKRSLEPVFSSLSHRQFSPEDAEAEVTVRGKNFMEGCTIALKKGGSFITMTPLPGQDNDRLTFRLNPSSLPGGTYDLVITNPGDNSTVAPGAIQVTALPVFSGISPSSVRDTVEQQTVTIKGRRLMKDVKVILKKDNDTITPLETVQHSLEKVTFTVSPAKMKRGSYDLIISNPGDNRHTEKGALRIQGELGLTLAAGGFYSILLPQWDSLLSSSFTGGEFYTAWQPPFLAGVPFAENLGLEARFIYTMYGSAEASLPDMTVMTFGGGIVYGIPITRLFSIALRGGSGAASSSLEDGSSSMDPWFYGGLSFRLTPGRIFFLEAGADFHYLLYLSEPLQAVYPFLRMGLRF